MRHFTSVIVCGLLVVSSALALEFLPPNILLLSDDDMEMCNDGGCSLVPDKQIRELVVQKMQQAYKAGRSSCGKSI